MRLTRLFFALVFAIALGPPVIAQSTSGPFTISSGTSACATISVTAQSSVVVKVSGTFSMTLQPEVSVRGQTPDNTVVTPSSSTSGTKQSTITGAGSYSSAVGSYDTFLVCVTSYVSGTATIILNASPATNAGLFVGGGAASSVPFSGVTAAINTNALQEGSGGSIVQNGVGQIFGTGAELFGGVPYPVAAITSTSGGSLGGSGFNFQITYNTAAGETYPSATISLNMSTCSGGACQVTITGPSSLPAGVTGYTAYDCNSSSTCTPLKQAASSPCVNLGAGVNCLVTVAGAGAGVPTSNTAWIQPPNVQTNTCPPGVIPLSFVQDSSLNYQTAAGVDEFSDTTNGPNAPGGWLTFCRRVVISDTQASPPTFKNSLFLINHLYSSTNPNTVLTNQDLALGIFAFNPTNDAAAHYAEEGIQSEVDLNGTPTFSAHIDGEVTSGSFQTRDNHTNAIASGPALGVNAVRATINRAGTGSMGGCPNGNCWIGVQATSFNNNASASSGNFAGVVVTVDDAAGGSGAQGRGVHIIAPGASRFTGLNYGLDVQNYGTNALDANIFSESSTSTAGKNYFVGAEIFGSGNNNPSQGSWWTTSWLGHGSISTVGSLGSSAQLGTPPAPTLSTTGTPGSTSYTYAVVAVDGNGNASPGPTTTKATGNATLGAGNNITVQWASNSVPGTDHYLVYRTASGGTPSTTGVIGTIVMCPPDPAGGNGLGCGGTITFTDSGLAGDSSTIPPANTTASVKGFKPTTLTNCAASGTAASPSVVACGSASAGTIYCDIAASAGTCTVNTTAVTTNSEIHIQPNGADGTLLSKTCNTAPSVVPFALLASKSNGTSFTINMPTGTTNGFCFEYTITN